MAKGSALSHQDALQAERIVSGNDWCELGDVLGSAAVLSAESDRGRMTHPETSMKDNISSLQAALVRAFKMRDPLHLSRQQLNSF